MDYLRQHVVPLVVTRWDDIGSAFGIDCEAVRSNYKQDTTKCCEDMLIKWLASGRASWDQLMEALKSIKLEKIAEDIQQLLQCQTTTSGMQLIIATMKICIFTKKIN